MIVMYCQSVSPLFYRHAIFKLWTDRRLVCLFFDVLRTSTQGSAKETQHTSSSATSYIYVFFPLELSLNSNPKIEGTIDVVQGFSIHFICCIDFILCGIHDRKNIERHAPGFVPFH